MVKMKLKEITESSRTFGCYKVEMVIADLEFSFKPKFSWSFEVLYDKFCMALNCINLDPIELEIRS